MVIITTFADIESWVGDVRPDVGECGLAGELAEAIRSAKHPPWGEDWEAWLRANVSDLVDGLPTETHVDFSEYGNLAVEEFRLLPPTLLSGVRISDPDTISGNPKEVERIKTLILDKRFHVVAREATSGRVVEERNCTLLELRRVENYLERRWRGVLVDHSEL